MITNKRNADTNILFTVINKLLFLVYEAAA